MKYFEDQSIVNPPANNSGLQRGKSFKTRIGQYSTPMESIQGNTGGLELEEEDEDVPWVMWHVYI